MGLGLAAVSSAEASLLLSPKLSVTGQSFATESSPSSKIGMDLSLGTDARHYTGLPHAEGVPIWEFNFYSFYESGKSGDFSLDIDQSAARIPLGGSEHFAGHLWFGRVHPETEGRASASGFPASSASRQIPATSAIGANWVQNQSDPLNPRVSGWVGLGVHARNDYTGIFVTGAYSPVFLPSFGPRLEFSASENDADYVNDPSLGASSGSRFARLPPQYAIVNGQELPLRYRIAPVRIRDVVLQNQYFVSLGREDRYTDFHLMAWWAPNPAPQTSTDALLHVHSEKDINVQVAVDPSFPRQMFWGAHWSLSNLFPNPTLEAVYERGSRTLTLSAQIHPWRFFKAGALHTIEREQPPKDEDDPAAQVINPLYAKELVWGEISTGNLLGRLKPSLRVEQHLAEGEHGQWVKPSLLFQAESRLALVASANILTGQSKSYFGAWRSLDSVSMGAVCQW